MVSFMNDGSKRKRASSESPPAVEYLGDAVQRQRTTRHRKQKITTRLSDSGFEEDWSPLNPSPPPPVVSPLRPGERPSATRELSNWHHHYGDVGYKIEKDKEAHFRSSRCLARQPQAYVLQITAEARCKLVSWLVPVHKYLHLSFECCCLAVNIMDRFLACTPVASDCFQLLGVTALLLASKQVEVFSPRVSQLLSLCCGAFTREQLCSLELMVLLRLHFRLAAPTLAFFLGYHSGCPGARCLRAGGGADTRTLAMGEGPAGEEGEGEGMAVAPAGQCCKLAQRVCELSLADYAFNHYPPSLTAICALTIAGELLGTSGGAGGGPCGPIGALRTSQTLVRSTEGQRGALAAIDASADKLAPITFTQDAPEASDDEYASVLPPAGSHGNSLALECRENLKLLVSLNQETLHAL